MTPFMRMRERIRNIIRTHEVIYIRVMHGILMLLSLAAVMREYPFATGLNHWWIVLVLSVLGAFMPLSAMAVVIFSFLLLNLFALSGQAAVALLVMLVFSYAFCAIYRAKRTYNISAFVVARMWSVPSVVPMQTALLGDGNEVVTIICGAVVSFFLHEVHSNAGVLLDTEAAVSIVDFLRERVISNQLFYTYLIAMTAMFLVTYALRTRNMNHAWMIAVVGGVSVEFLIMLAGYLMQGVRTGISSLLFGNVFSLLVGVATNYFYRDLDYSRIEKVQFEDDEYYYYVTAVPKIQLAEEKKEVKMINRVLRESKKGRNK